MHDLLGYRATLGFVTPASNTVVIADACRVSLTGVTVHQSDYRVSAGHPDTLAAAIGDAIERMRTRAVTISALCADEELIDGQAFADALPQLHTSEDIVLPSDALRAALGCFDSASRVAVVSPFVATRHGRAVERVRGLGANVVADVRAEIADERAAARTSYVAMRELYDRAMAGGADLLVQLGHNLPMARQVDNFEEDHGKPVLAINTVCTWHMLRQNGIGDPIPGHGALLMDH